jgi:aspartokinase
MFFLRLAKEVGLDAGALTDVLELLKELDQILYGLRLLKEESPRLRARVCSFGERLSTVLAVQIMKHHGLACSLLPVTVRTLPIHLSILRCAQSLRKPPPSGHCP